MTMRFFDSHCHIDERLPGGIDGSIAAAREAGVEQMITVGCDLASSQTAIDVAAGRDGVWATVGLHPHDASNGLDGLVELIGAPKVLAIGECGLDYHYDHSPRDIQKEIFAAQIQLAHEHGLPLVIHTRSAWDDTFDILDAEKMPAQTIFHCFTGGPDEARKCLDRGAFLSFSGIVTFKTAEDLRQAARLCPPERMLIETDSPFLAPIPHRGTKNQPSYVSVVAASLAETLGRELAEVAETSWNAAMIAFSVPTS
jgi:TatD DNase family protein